MTFLRRKKVPAMTIIARELIQLIFAVCLSTPIRLKYLILQSELKIKINLNKQKVDCSFAELAFNRLWFELALELQFVGGDTALIYFAIDEFVVEEDDKRKEKEAAALEKVENTKADVFIGEGFVAG